MPRFTLADWKRLQARQTPTQAKPSDAVAREADLHDAIAAECKARGWLFFHSRMDRRTGRTLGEPDFIILADAGRVFFIEAKAKAGKLSNEQIGVQVWARKLGHTIHTLYKLEQFINVIGKEQQ